MICVECGHEAAGKAFGWKAYLLDNPEVVLEPTLVFYCPDCAADYFGDIPRNRREDQEWPPPPY